MERKTKHRILGTLVLIGLVVILLPLFEGKRELSSEAVVVKAPAFPEQSAEVAAIDSETAPNQPVLAAEAKENNNRQPDDLLSTLHPSTVSSHAPAETTAPSATPSVAVNKESTVTELAPVVAPAAINTNMQLTSSQAASPSSAKLPVHKKIMKKIAKAAHPVKQLAAHRMPIVSHQPLDNDGLIRLKNAAWVVQMGSFKNKSQAIRLVNQLRASGYRAFIQQIANTLNSHSTRVFVGPENKQTSARALASRLETDMHIRGIVISYKPLTL